MTRNQEVAARAGITALIASHPPTWRHPTFPVREVRAAAVRCGDVLAHPVNGDALVVLGVGYSIGAAVVIYVRRSDVLRPGATSKFHFTAHEFVLRAIGSVGSLPVQPRAEDQRPHRPGQTNHDPDVAERVVGVEPDQRYDSAERAQRSERRHNSRDSAALIGTWHAPHPSPAQPRAVHPGHERTTP